MAPAGPEPAAPGPIRLDQFLKWQGLVFTGGEAKLRIQGGEVRVNGFQETQRGRRLRPGDRVELAGLVHVVPAPGAAPGSALPEMAQADPPSIDPEPDPAAF
ncbi:MAG: hypothetical protein RLZZ219_414 [Cyanobacteriota bacterium]